MPFTPNQLRTRIKQEVSLAFGTDWQAFIDSRIDDVVTKVITELIDERLAGKVKEVLYDTTNGPPYIKQIIGNIDI